MYKQAFIKKTIVLGYFIMGVFMMGCESDPCDEGYTQVRRDGMDICLPDYLAGTKVTPESGNRFYHQKYGVITFEDGMWWDEDLNHIEHTELDNN